MCNRHTILSINQMCLFVLSCCRNVHLQTKNSGVVLFINEIVLALFYIQTFLCAVLLWGRGHGVSGSSKRTHDLQRARPVIPGPEKQAR